MWKLSDVIQSTWLVQKHPVSNQLKINKKKIKKNWMKLK
jgi:hypothetical protein